LGSMASVALLPAALIESLRVAMQAAINTAVRADSRDQTEACVIGAHMLGLWKADAGGKASEAAMARIQEVSFIATAAINASAAKASPPDDLVEFVGRSILGSTPRLDFCEQGWGHKEYAVLAAALPGCVSLESLTIAGMTLNDADAALLVAALPPTLKSLSLSCAGLRRCPDLSRLTTLRVLSLGGCQELTEPPAVSMLPFLERLDLFGCPALTVPPVVSALTGSLQIVNLAGCVKLDALPDVSGLTPLRTLVAPDHLKT